jgi:hypothetical protein
VGAVRPAVVGVQVLDELDAEHAEGERPCLWDAVAVAGVGEQIPDRDPVSVHVLDDGDDLGGRVVLAAGEVDATRQLGHVGTVFVFDDRGRLQVVAVEQL